MIRLGIRCLLKGAGINFLYILNYYCSSENTYERYLKIRIGEISMINEERKMINKPVGHNCFACGTANPIGLQLEFYRSGEQVCSDITLGRNYVGWENIAHGGIISTIHDEVMSWAVLYFKREFFLTRKMQVKYIKPVLVEIPLTIKGSIIDGSNKRKLKARSELFDGNGNLLSKGSGEFILIKKEELTSVPEGLKEEMFA